MRPTPWGDTSQLLRLMCLKPRSRRTFRRGGSSTSSRDPKDPRVRTVVGKVSAVRRSPRQLFLCSLLVTLAASAAGCSFESRHLPDRPLSPGEVVSITGSGFGKMAGTIYFPSIDGATTLAPIYRWDDGAVQIRVPDDAGSGRLQVYSSTTADKAILEVQVRIAQPRRGMRSLTVRLSPASGSGIAVANVFTSNGGDPIADVRVIVESGHALSDGPRFLLTDSNGTVGALVKTWDRGYIGTIFAGNLYVMLEHPNQPGLSSFPHGAVAVAELATVTSKTTKLPIRVRLSDREGNPRAGETVLVSANQCANAPDAGESALMTDSEGIAEGTIECPRPRPSVIAVQALASGSDGVLALEVRE
jgi:hypothetical protein